MKAVTVLISGGFGGAYERLLPEFERTSLIKVTTRREQGHKRLRRNSPAASLPMQ